MAPMLSKFPPCLLASQGIALPATALHAAARAWMYLDNAGVANVREAAVESSSCVLFGYLAKRSDVRVAHSAVLSEAMSPRPVLTARHLLQTVAAHGFIGAAPPIWQVSPA